ncbi:ribulose-phosphate 3-epimerase [Clostridium sp. 19966]|uniref:ribulose-phosphate 3-epimerase n=1 Tax=Clostridium sp. 19966 TaxID=2768166 RepID=UPI0028E08A62|nr:ribulose-phosphate 3-epimerase [Clostridium sp. 19966]MDT8718706.1 ribulose-phosphate 3-epimerase [Clostridium sp. 19966]
MIKLSPSILSSDFSKLGEEVKLLDEAGADLIHIDVMDGNFVPNITLGPPIIKALRPYTKLPFDVHLMIENPSNYIKDFVEAGSDIITVHYESDRHMDRLVDYIKGFNVKAGIALNPSTPVSFIKHLLHKIDLVLIMSVNPGFGGQSFIPYSLDKIKELTRLKQENNYRYEINVDGGISADNCKEAAAAGANILVSGSGIFKNHELKENIKKFREVLKKY